MKKTDATEKKAELEQKTEERVQRIIETAIRLLPRFKAAPSKSSR